MVSLNPGGPHTSATAGALQDFCLETGDQTEQVLNLNLLDLRSCIQSNQSDPECLSYPEINEIYQELFGLESSTPPKMPDNYYPKIQSVSGLFYPFFKEDIWCP